MGALAAGAAWALWLGILTSISPCPLATNIAAISFLGRRLDRPAAVVLAGLAYTLGRTVAYVALALVTVGGLLAVPPVARFLESSMNKVLGPVLIVAGVFLLELVPVSFTTFSAGERSRRLAERGGLAGAGLLGILFALAFCPVSAALFFGSLVPSALKAESPVLMPTAYGIGTALPVVVFAALVALGARQMAKAFGVVQKVERWARRTTGVVFLLVGVYYTLVHIFGLAFLWPWGT
ncbi:MAG: sulfite exporter TauE/SafE family protein [Planctomycetes bacterium]|nr:sulfite exporter TauE/SafE family protein [Planctomycetota bacterium]